MRKKNKNKNKKEHSPLGKDRGKDWLARGEHARSMGCVPIKDMKWPPGGSWRPQVVGVQEGG